MTALRRARRGGGIASALPQDFDDQKRNVVERVLGQTMTSPERIGALVDAVRYIVRGNVPGAIVECGVWRGGSMMAVALTLLDLHAPTRDLYLFDTFAGMPPPTNVDVDAAGELAADRLAREAPGDSWVWAIADLDAVRTNVSSTGYPSARVHYTVGKVEDTLPEHAPDRIALLRLDT
jgi:hypothetical protein